MKAKEFLKDYAVDDLNVFGRHEEHYSLPDLMEEYAEAKAIEFIAQIKKEFPDQNWDYFNFIADRIYSTKNFTRSLTNE